MKPSKQFIDTLDKAKSVLILVHQKPDGDAIGSAVAMGKGLKSLGKEVDYYIDSNIEPKVKFFDEINNFNQDLKEHYDVILLLDCSTLDYAFQPEKLPDYEKLAVIDHHKSNENFGDENFVHITGAAAELVYLTLKELEVDLDDEMKTAIFTALSTDTGSFQFSNATDQTFNIAADLHKDGKSYAPISKRLHALKTADQLKLYAEAINSMELLEDGKIAILTLPYDTVKKYGGFANITDDTSNIGVNVDTSMVSALIKEVRPNEFKMSFRSKSPFDIDVSELALKYNGGGHFRASGASFNGSLEELREKLIPDLINLVSDV